MSNMPRKTRAYAPLWGHLGKSAKLATALMVFASPAHALDWESLAESGVLCRALLADPDGFVAKNRNALDRYWRADSVLVDDGSTLVIGKEAEFFWVTLRETRDWDQMRLSCAVNINPAWLRGEDLAVLEDWYRTWGASVVASQDYSKAADGEIVKTGLNARGCVVAMRFTSVAKAGAIQSIAYETGDVAGCGGASMLAMIQDKLGR